MHNARKVVLPATAIAVAVAVFAVAGWFGLPHLDGANHAGEKQQSGRTVQAKVADPRKTNVDASVTAASVTRAPRPYETDLRKRFLESKNLYPLFQELSQRTDAEAAFMRAHMLDFCKGKGATYKGESRDSQLARVKASLTGNFLEVRRKIYDDWKDRYPQHLCRDFPNAITNADVEVAFKAAAEAGDLRARVDQIHRVLLENGDKKTLDTGPDSIFKAITMIEPKGPTPAEVDTLKGALASKDPTLILAAGPLLTARYLEYELRLPDGKGIEISDYSIWKSVACHYAGGCGIDSPFVKLDCAMHGRCDVSTYDELTQKYQLTEEKWQKFLEYRALLIRAIDSQDWTILNESRGRTTNLFHNMISTQSSPRFRLRVGG